MTKTSFRKLSPKEFDAALLEKLTREGRVYVNLPKTISKDAYIREILDYVRSIRNYAAEEWCNEIDGLWKNIVDNGCLADFLTMKKGLCAGHMNRYAVTLLVYRMHSMGIYTKDVSMLTLHLKLEGSTRKNRYYTSCGNYAPQKEERRILREIFKSIK